MDEQLRPVLVVCSSIYGKNVDIPTDFPETLKELRSLSNAESGARIRTAFYVSVLVETLARGNKEAMDDSIRYGVFGALVNRLKKKIPLDSGHTNDGSISELEKKACLQGAIILHKNTKKGSFLNKSILVKLFKEQDGINWLLATPRKDATFLGLSSCLDEISSHEEIMQHVCSIRHNVENVVKLALDLVEKQRDLTNIRHHAASFFCKAFAYKAVLKAFDKKAGLDKILESVHGDGLVISDRTKDMLLTKPMLETARSTCIALECYFKAQLVLKMDPDVDEPLPIRLDVMDKLWLSLQKNPADPSFSGWPIVRDFLGSQGHIGVLTLCQGSKNVILDDIVKHALGILCIISLDQTSVNTITNARLTRQRDFADIIMKVADPDQYSKDEAANEDVYLYAENAIPALKFLDNIVRPVASDAREIFCEKEGVALLTNNLKTEEYCDKNFNCIWALICRILRVLAEDVLIADRLIKAKVDEKLLKFIKDHPVIPGDARGEWQVERERASAELYEVLANRRGPTTTTRAILTNQLGSTSAVHDRNNETHGD